MHFSETLLIKNIYSKIKIISIIYLCNIIILESFY